MKKINEIPKLNIYFAKKSSNLTFYTPRSNKTENNIISKSNNYLLSSYNKFPPRLSSPFSNVISPNKTCRPNNNYTCSNFYIKSNNNLLSSYKILNIKDYVLSDRLKTSSTRHSEQTIHKDKLDKISETIENKKKMKLKKNKNNCNSLIKNIKNLNLNEVNFIPSPYLINTSKLSNKNLLNVFKPDKKLKKNILKKENKKNDENLPIFLREKYNIKGTNIMSPFCIKARDESLYKRIFYTYFKKPIIVKRKGIDNKLNIIYAENEDNFKKKIKKINEQLKKEGKKEKNSVFPNSIQYKLAQIKHKIKFMKKIVDYAYPEMVLTRVREANKILEYGRNKIKNSIPFKSADNKLQNNNKILTKHLAKSFIVSKL